MDPIPSPPSDADSIEASIEVSLAETELLVTELEDFINRHYRDMLAHPVATENPVIANAIGALVDEVQRVSRDFQSLQDAEQRAFLTDEVLQRVRDGIIKVRKLAVYLARGSEIEFQWAGQEDVIDGTFEEVLPPQLIDGSCE